MRASTSLWRKLCRRSVLRHAIERLCTPSGALEVVVRVPVLLLVLGWPCRVDAQSYCAHLMGEVVDILLALICRRLLRWEIALLLHRCPVLRWRACVLVLGLTDRRTATLVVASRTGGDWRPPLIWLIFTSRIVWICRVCAESVIHGEIGHGLRRGTIAGVLEFARMALWDVCS